MKIFVADRVFDGYTLQTQCAVAIHHDGTVVQLGPKQTIVNHFPFAEIVNVNGIISPGFVNAHCHTELSHLKGKIARGTGLNQFLDDLQKVRQPNSDEAHTAAAQSVEYMHQQGIVAVGDVCNTSLMSTITFPSHMWCHHFIELFAIDAKQAQQAYEKWTAIYHTFHSAHKSMVPHAPYSVSDTLMRLIASRQERVMTIHNQETEGENEMFRTKTGPTIERLQAWNISLDSFMAIGKNPPLHYLPLMHHCGTLALVHNTYTSPDDVTYVMNNYSNVFWCLCPRANIFIENKLPPVHLLAPYSNHVCLGTDSLASNDDLSILHEMRALQPALCNLNKNRNDTKALETLLQWATANGAKFLKLDNVLGTIKPGMRPGLISIENIGNDCFITKDTYIRLLA